MPPQERALAKGQVLGRYELLAPIARGGMGQVWAARLRGARGFHKLVAIKTVLPMLDDAGRMDRMLFDEARIASLVQHSNVAQTLELGEHEGMLYLVMEWIDGEPLSYLLSCAEQRGGMPLPIAVNLVAQALRGLHAAHELVDDAVRGCDPGLAADPRQDGEPAVADEIERRDPAAVRHLQPDVGKPRPRPTRRLPHHPARRSSFFGRLLRAYA